MTWLRDHTSLLIVAGIIAGMAWWLDAKIERVEGRISDRLETEIGRVNDRLDRLIEANADVRETAEESS